MNAAPKSAAPPDYVELGFQQIEREVRWLTGCLAEVLEGMGEGCLAQWLPWRGDASGATGGASAEPPA